MRNKVFEGKIPGRSQKNQFPECPQCPHFAKTMEEQNKKTGFIPDHGGYKNLLSYQKSEIIYDGTVYFTGRYFNKYDRTVDQMVQAARSGKQNIVEASMASALSKKTELMLTNVARASQEELMEDYKDFLRVKDYQKWIKIISFINDSVK